MKYFRIIFINIIILYVLLYSFELFLNISSNKLFSKTRLHYLNLEQKKTNSKVYLNFGAYKLLDDRNINLLPLSGYERSKILLCLNEKNQPIYYYSDKNGFRNLYNEKKNFDFLIIGDSYVQGMCVDEENNFISNLEKFNFSGLSFGIAGNGPLLEYATFQEYQRDYKYKNIILFLTPDNDFYDLFNEKKNKVLNQYLEDKNFTQHFSNKEKKLIKKKILDDYFGNKTSRMFNDFLSIYHFNLKQVGNLIEKISKIKTKKINYEYLFDEDVDRYLNRIIQKFSEKSQNDNFNFYVVFNSVSPNILFPKTNEEKKLNKILFDKIKDVKIFLIANKIKYFDFNEYLKENYNTENIKNIFKKIDGRWDHYTNEGNLIIIKEFIKKFKL